MAVTPEIAQRQAERQFKETEEAISLHGLGFLQVKLGASQRLHVWHPDLPRRRCFRQSAIHDHRFAFTSRVLVGTQINHLWKVDRPGGSHPTHILYSSGTAGSCSGTARSAASTGGSRRSSPAGASGTCSSTRSSARGSRWSAA